jgi:ubiquinone/menaquinone biosynthesis C-methylase UbiE
MLQPTDTHLRAPRATSPVAENDRRAQHNARVRAHFDALADRYLDLKKLNAFYNDYLIRWTKALVPPRRRVLDIGCGRGDVLAAVRPTVGLGLDLSPTMVRRAAADHGHGTSGLQFIEQAVEEFQGDGTFDAALLTNTLEYAYDIGAILDRARAALRDNGRLLITTANPVWSPIFKAASKVGMRIPECDRLWVTNEDLDNLLKLHGFEVVDKRMDLVLPKPVPGLGDALNWAVSRTPVMRYLGSTQLIAARKLPEKARAYSVSAIVPCYNEAGNVERCVREMVKLGSRTELIIVDDGSKDGTAALVNPALRSDIDVKVVSYSPNVGKGNAVQRGFERATGDILMILDADLTTHPEELGPLYEAMSTGRAEFVNCTRFVYPMDGQAMKFANYVGNKVFTIAVSLVMDRRVSDTLCGTKAMFRTDYEHFTMGRDPWGDYDFLFGAAQLRLAVCELPVHYRDRLAGVSKMNSMKHAKNLVRMCLHGFRQVQILTPIPEPRRAGANGGRG